MPSMIRPLGPSRLRLSRTRRMQLSKVYNGTLAALRGVTHPNALLTGLVVAPVLVVGLAFGEPTAEAREAASRSLGSVAATVGFGVDSVQINGLRDTREGDVLDYLAVTPTTSVLGFDIDAARDRVIALPWVKEASVRRVYPDGLVVDIEEHAPFARMINQGRILLVTLEGKEITDEISPVHAALPLVMGQGAAAGATDFFAHLAARPIVLGDVVALERVGERRWTLHMREDVQVHLPEEGVDDALMQLEAMIRRDAVLDRAVAVIDLRLEDRLTVQLTQDAIDALENGAEGLTASQGGAT